MAFRRRRRSFRATARRPSPYEMQQLSICRLGMQTVVTPSCTEPSQFLTGLVSPRREYAGNTASPGTEIIPAFAKGVTVGGVRFRYSYSINYFLANGLEDVTDIIGIRSALVVLPLADSSAELPGVFPTNVLHLSGTIPETNQTVGLGYTRPRILWRGYDELPFISPSLFTTDFQNSVRSSQSQPDLQVVKSKVSLGHNEALYFLTEFQHGMQLDSFNNFTLELDLFGVAAVKPTTATR